MSENHSTNDTLRGVGYWRKSDDDDGGSVEQQREWAQGVCPGENIELVRDFEDQSISGHDTDKRLGFHATLKFCQEEYRKGRPIDVVVCWHSNRFSRADSNETGFYVWSFRQCGVNRIFTSKGWIDFREMADRIMFNLNQDVSNHAYSKDLSQAVSRGLAKRARNGLHNGGRVPYGYRLENCRLVPDPATAPILLWLFESYGSKDLSLYALAADLNRRGVPSPNGKTFWSPRTIAGILHNPAYLGDLHYGRKARGKFFTLVNLEIKERKKDNGKLRPKDKEEVFVKEGNHEALVPRPLFLRVQQRLAARTKRTTPLTGDRNDFLLTGLLQCGNCESAHSPHHAKQSDGTYAKVYRCNGYSVHGKVHCASNLIHEDILLRAIVRKIRETYLDPELLDKLREVIRRQDEDEAHADTAQVGRLQARRDELDRKIDLGTRRLMEEEDDSLVPGHRKHLQGLHEERKAVQAQLDGLATTASRQELEEGVDAAVAQLERLLGVFRGGEPALVRVALWELISKVELFFDVRRGPKQNRSTFVKALIYVREDFGLSELGNTVKRFTRHPG
jgi:site-specific DNA recombinase